jgi:hypothetical protein
MCSTFHARVTSCLNVAKNMGQDGSAGLKQDQDRAWNKTEKGPRIIFCTVPQWSTMEIHSFYSIAMN